MTIIIMKKPAIQIHEGEENVKGMASAPADFRRNQKSRVQGYYERKVI
jgi:hypothetical protein